MGLRIRAALAAAGCLWALAAHAGDALAPPENLVLDGVPPIPADIAEKLRPYGEFRPHRLLSWHPTRREMLVARRLRETVQVHRIASPGSLPAAVTDLPDAVSSAAFQPVHGDYFVFAMGRGGNEAFRVYRNDGSAGPVPLSPEGERAGEAAWSRKGDRIAFTTVPTDASRDGRPLRTRVHVMDPVRPQAGRVVATLAGGGWGSLRFSPDGKRLVLVQHVSANESHLWTLDVAGGKPRRITPVRAGERVSWREPHFAPDNRAVFATSDRGSEYRRLVYLAPGGRERVLTGHLPHDVDDLDVSHDAGLVAFTTNERGAHVLRFMDAKTLKELPRPPLVDGVIGGLAWRRGSDEIGFHIASARTAGDVFSYEVKANRLTRWTNGNSPEVNTRELVEPRLVRWKSFDGLEISGFLYAPPARFTGKRPVVVNIHGGPESQARPRFIGRYNHWVNDLGIAVVYPNVRGSLGFGKTFLALDDGRRREDAVKDIGALLDWIAQQPELDASRVVVMGGSYGGYMAMACAVHYAERLAGAMATVGISNFVTFLERTEGYRRDLRRAEYGDERDPRMREFLESISPLRHAGRIARPLLVAQGLNDPRVPYTEAEQIVATLRQRGTPAWYLLARDEGHGFARKPNADFLFAAMTEFLRRTLAP